VDSIENHNNIIRLSYLIRDTSSQSASEWIEFRLRSF
jgi:hypothetical protein